MTMTIISMSLRRSSTRAITNRVAGFNTCHPPYSALAGANAHHSPRHEYTPAPHTPPDLPYCASHGLNPDLTSFYGKIEAEEASHNPPKGTGITAHGTVRSQTLSEADFKLDGSSRDSATRESATLLFRWCGRCKEGKPIWTAR